MKLLVAYFSLFAVCCFTPSSAQWAFNTSVIDGQKQFFVAPASIQGSWWYAHNYCRRQGLDLASIESQAEMDSVQTLLLKQVGVDYRRYFWTSGSDRGRIVNDFVWFSNGRTVKNYTKWAPGQPDSRGTQDSIRLWNLASANRSRQFYFDDEYELGQGGVLCEKNITSPTTGLGTNPVYYVETKAKVDWFEANVACRRQGRRLASIESLNDTNKLKVALAAHFNGSTFQGEFWTSGTSNGQNFEREKLGFFQSLFTLNWPYKTFFWLSTGKTFSTRDKSSYNAWGAYQPNYSENLRDENCVAVRAAVRPPLAITEWHDYPCDTRMIYVCETRT